VGTRADVKNILLQPTIAGRLKRVLATLHHTRKRFVVLWCIFPWRYLIRFLLDNLVLLRIDMYTYIGFVQLHVGRAHSSLSIVFQRFIFFFTELIKRITSERFVYTMFVLKLDLHFSSIRYIILKHARYHRSLSLNFRASDKTN